LPGETAHAPSPGTKKRRAARPRAVKTRINRRVCYLKACPKPPVQDTITDTGSVHSLMAVAEKRMGRNLGRNGRCRKHVPAGTIVRLIRLACHAHISSRQGRNLGRNERRPDTTSRQGRNLGGTFLHLAGFFHGGIDDFRSKKSTLKGYKRANDIASLPGRGVGATLCYRCCVPAGTKRDSIDSTTTLRSRDAVHCAKISVRLCLTIGYKKTARSQAARRKKTGINRRVCYLKACPKPPFRIPSPTPGRSTR
jgi:hypothetical protein